MADATLTLTLADYARVMPLVTGAVAPEGVKLDVITGKEGSWPDRAALLGRGKSAQPARAQYDLARQGSHQALGLQIAA